MVTDSSVISDTPVETRLDEVCEVRTHPRTHQNALYALRSFALGEVLAKFSAASVHRTPTYLTVQIGDEQHIELLPRVLQYMNHSCEPNCFFDTTRMQVTALRNIDIDEELTFFYPSSEWHMTQPFECLCGAESCLHVIAGADSLSDEVLKRYRLTEYIQSNVNHR